MLEIPGNRAVSLQLWEFELLHSRALGASYTGECSSPRARHQLIRGRQTLQLVPVIVQIRLRGAIPCPPNIFFVAV